MALLLFGLKAGYATVFENLAADVIGSWVRQLVLPPCDTKPGKIYAHIPVVHHNTFPLMYWCPACESVWAWYVARCPDCWIGNLWKKNCKKGMVTCTMCGLDIDVETAQELNEQEVWNNEL